MTENSEQSIRRILTAARDAVRMVSFGEEAELRWAYGQRAAERLTEQARHLPDTSSFDWELARLINLIEGEFNERIATDLHGVSFRAIGPPRDISGAIMEDVRNALQFERTKLSLERVARVSALPPGELWRKDWVTVAQATTMLGCTIDHTRTLYRTGKIAKKKHGRGVVVSVESIRDYLWRPTPPTS
jgi:hypothetical protein